MTLLLIALDFTATTRCKRLTPPSSSLREVSSVVGNENHPFDDEHVLGEIDGARRRTVVPDGDETRLSTGASARRHRASRHRPGESFGTWLDFLVECRSGGCAHHATSPSSSRLDDSSGDRSRTSNPLAAGCRQVLDTTGTGNGKGLKQVASSAAANGCLQPC